jgi:predicted O-methyltransferase YrrM
MVKYNLEHLTQADSQEVGGPIQDDEALLLFAIIRCMRLRTIIEIGGLSGYSAMNFCAAVGPAGRVITVDLHELPEVAPNHTVILNDALKLRGDAFGVDRFDLVFFDCHDAEAQLQFLENLEQDGLVDQETVICLHDTNTHPASFFPWAVEGADGWVHQVAERIMVNALHENGYDAFCVHSRHDRHDATMPFRHGLTLMRRFRPLAV